MSSKQSTEQGRSGRAGAEASQPGEPGSQPRQGSDRVELPREAAEPKHHFDAGRAPAEQGKQENPSAERIARDQQGLAGRGNASGSHASGDRSEGSAQSGAPAGDHTRHGRQQISGDRPNR